MKVAAAAASCWILASSSVVAAFAPPPTSQSPSIGRTTSSSSSSSFSSALGAVDWSKTFGTTVETANKVPPLAKYIEVDERGAKWFQNAEIKNGRVAMLATLGYVSSF